MTANDLRVNMGLESLKPIVDEFNINANSPLWDYIYETFIKEKEARNFVKSILTYNNNIDLNSLSKEDCEKHFIWLCRPDN